MGANVKDLSTTIQSLLFIDEGAERYGVKFGLSGGSGSSDILIRKWHCLNFLDKELTITLYSTIKETILVLEVVYYNPNGKRQ